MLRGFYIPHILHTFYIGIFIVHNLHFYLSSTIPAEMLNCVSRQLQCEQTSLVCRGTSAAQLPQPDETPHQILRTQIITRIKRIIIYFRT